MTTRQDGTFETHGESAVTPRPARGDILDPACPTRELLNRVGDKWTSLAIRALAEAHPGELRFAELGRAMPGVSRKMLSVTLRGLGRDGLVTRRVQETVPPSVYYRLTDLGLSLESPLAALREWAEAHMREVDDNIVAYERTTARLSRR